MRHLSLPTAPLWLLLLCAPLRAAVVAGPEPVFPAAAGSWAGPLAFAFHDPAAASFLPAGMTALSLQPALMPRETAPLVAQLSIGLGLTPQAFAKLAPADRISALQMASDEAKEQVRTKVYELADRARTLSAPGKALDKHERAELYEVVAQLMEVRDHYGSWIEDPAVNDQVNESFSLASARAWEVRAALVDDTVGGSGAPAFAAAAAAASAPAFKLNPTSTARTLREQMKATKSGWGQNDFDTLYTGYGFVLRQGGKHRFYYHPTFPQLHETVSRQNDLPPGYAQSALKLISQLEELAAPKAVESGAPTTGPPANLTLADISVLLSPPAAKPAKVKKAVENKMPVRRAADFPEKTKPTAVVEVPPAETPLVPSDEPVEKPRPTGLAPATVREPKVAAETPLPEKTNPDRPRSIGQRLKSWIWPGSKPD